MKKNLITVLKKLLAAFGGEETQSNNAVEVIDKIADSVEQGGGSGDRGPLVLEFATEDPYTVTTPLSEIKAAIEAGRQVWFKKTFDLNPLLLQLTYWKFNNTQPDVESLYFNLTRIEGFGTYTVKQYSVNYDYYSDPEWNAKEITA